MEISIFDLENLNDDELDDLCRQYYRRLAQGESLEEGTSPQTMEMGEMEREMLEDRIELIQEYKYMRRLRSVE